jgi:hypothetical protein
MRYGVRKVSMDWKPVVEWLDSKYRFLMLGAMAIELMLLLWIAWKA